MKNSIVPSPASLKILFSHFVSSEKEDLKKDKKINRATYTHRANNDVNKLGGRKRCVKIKVARFAGKSKILVF